MIANVRLRFISSVSEAISLCPLKNTAAKLRNFHQSANFGHERRDLRDFREVDFFFFVARLTVERFLPDDFKSL